MSWAKSLRRWLRRHDTARRAAGFEFATNELAERGAAAAAVLDQVVKGTITRTSFHDGITDAVTAWRARHGR